jgi:hypothetical protein
VSAGAAADARGPRTRRPSDALLRLGGARLVLWLLVTRTWIPELFTAATRVAWHFDEHYYYLHEDAARITILRYGQLPAWNPYSCGGIPALANPQDISLSPDFVLRLIFGTSAGRRIATILFVVLGMEGTYRLARRYDTAAAGAALAAVAFATSGRFAGLVDDGWLHMFAFELMPWAALGLEIGVHKRIGWLLGGCVLAWMVMCGGTYVVPYTGVLLGLMAATRSAGALWCSWSLPGRRWQAAAAPFACLVRMVGVAALLTAVRVLPMLAIIRAYPRYFYAVESASPADVLGGLALRPTAERLGHLLGTASTGWNYVGGAVFLLAVLAVLTLDRRGIWLGLLTLAFGALACGVHGRASPWALLHRLPLFTQLRSPYRFVVVAGLFLSLGAARGLTWVEDAVGRLVAFVRRRVGRPTPRPFTERLVSGWLGAVVASALAVLAARQTVTDHRVLPGTVYGLDGPVENRDGFRQAKGNRWDSHVYPAADRGVLACFEETEFPQSALLRGDEAQEEYPDPTSSAKVTRASWSPSRIVVHVDAPEPFDLFVNQNFDPGWRSNVGVVFSKEKLLAVHAPAGTYDLVLRYRDWKVTVGSAVSIVGLLWLAVLLWPIARTRLRAYRRALA